MLHTWSRSLPNLVSRSWKRSRRPVQRKPPVRYRPALEQLEELTLLSSINWTGAANDNSWNTAANGGVALSGAVSKTLDARTLDNFGTATWTGSGIIGILILSNGGVWNNQAGSVFDDQLPVSASISSGGGITPPQFNNAGLLLKS